MHADLEGAPQIASAALTAAAWGADAQTAQVAHENEVKALIKLRFVTSTGSPVVVLRSFQVRAPDPSRSGLDPA